MSWTLNFNELDINWFYINEILQNNLFNEENRYIISIFFSF